MSLVLLRYTGPIGEIEWTYNNSIKIKQSEWAPGIWAGAEGLELLIVSPSGKVKSHCKIVAVDLDNRVIDVNHLPRSVGSGDIIKEGKYANLLS